MTYYVKKFQTLTSIMVCSIALLAGCQQRSADEAATSSGGSSMGRTESGGASSALEKAETSDSAITAKVKAALLRDSKIKSTDISVETKRGEVILSGFVDNAMQVDEALKVAKGVDGVKMVTNKMKPRQ
jgi:hyperosmotically inducible protein